MCTSDAPLGLMTHGRAFLSFHIHVGVWRFLSGGFVDVNIHLFLFFLLTVDV